MHARPAPHRLPSGNRARRGKVGDATGRRIAAFARGGGEHHPKGRANFHCCLLRAAPWPQGSRAPAASFNSEGRLNGGLKTWESRRKIRDLLTPNCSGDCYIAAAFTGRSTVDEVLPRDAGGGQRDGSSKAIAQIVRLLDTIEVLGSPGHLSRPSDEGKVVEP